MAEQPRILIAGASGVFGRILAREVLETTAARLILVGRDYARVAAAGRALESPDRVETLALDLTRPEMIARVVRGCFAVACTAGPFQGLPRDLPRIAIEAGAHWLDIADDPNWLLPLLADRNLGESATALGLIVMPGLSTVPTLSGALVRWCLQGTAGARRARLTLWIGNHNQKGSGAIAGLLDSRLSAPKYLRLPVGRCLTYRMPSADEWLLRQDLDLETDFRVAFEWAPATPLLRLLGAVSRRLPGPARHQLATGISRLAAPFNVLGSSEGLLQVEIFGGGRDRAPAAAPPGTSEWRRSATVSGEGQRMAILPCALALQSLLKGGLRVSGLVRPASWLAPNDWIRLLQEKGISFRSVAEGRGLS